MKHSFWKAHFWGYLNPHHYTVYMGLWALWKQITKYDVGLLYCITPSCMLFWYSQRLWQLEYEQQLPSCTLFQALATRVSCGSCAGQISVTLYKTWLKPSLTCTIFQALATRVSCGSCYAEILLTSQTCQKCVIDRCFFYK